MECDHCGKEMTEAETCLEALDESVLPPAEFRHLLRNCHDCGVHPGGTHHPGCDTERCGACGGQALACGCEWEDYGPKRVENRWTGLWPGQLECYRLGFMCRDLDLHGRVVTMHEAIEIQNAGGRVKWHVPCGPKDEGAHADLNRWHREGCPRGTEIDKILAARPA